MRLVFFTIALFLCIGPWSSRAADLHDVGSYLEQQVREHKFSGDVLIAVHDHVIFEHAYGFANVQLHVPNTLQTRFRLFSVTKQFTAAALMSLAQKGKIDVGAPVSRYLEHWPVGWGRVTAAELLNHSSGIPQLENTWFEAFTDAGNRNSQCQNYNAIIGKLASSRVLTTPGATWRYNNFGYDLLGCVVERVSGASLASYMTSAVFRPAGMVDSGLVGSVAHAEPLYDGPRIIDDLATGYNGTSGMLGALQEAMSLQYASAAAGDMYATVGDLWRYSEALYRDRVLTDATQRVMLDDSVSVAGGFEGPSCAPACAPLQRVTIRNVRWGLGWRIQDVRGHVYVSHSGGNNGFSAEFARFPEEHATIVILSNFGFANVSSMRSRIAQIVFHGKYTP